MKKSDVLVDPNGVLKDMLKNLLSDDDALCICQLLKVAVNTFKIQEPIYFDVEIGMVLNVESSL